MSKSIYIIVAMLLIGCGGVNSSNQPNTIDPAFQALYNQFISDANTAGLNLSVNQGITMQFTTLGQPDGLGEVIGECMSVGYGNSTINIDPTFWNESGIEGQTLLIYHELGHCVLNEVHTTDQENIMYPIINYPEQYYVADWSVLTSKLFSQVGQ